MERLTRCVFGLTLFGTGIGMQKAGNLGLPPWDVFHDGVSKIINVPFGRTIVITSVFVMLLWIPLRQAPGLATILNAVEVGVTADIFLSIVPQADAMPLRIFLMLGGIVVTGIGSGFYIGAGLGPGPRDGLMVGLAKRGINIGKARTGVEIAVLIIGMLLGGSIGIGTVAFAVLIGPIVAKTLPLLQIRPAK
ncbi:MAG: hypothetical protein D4R95_01875 [Actinobacteria bacterium]|nr:MAG: hypothetical protein D4R95_01875 [Actinomycetota bacterium]